MSGIEKREEDDCKNIDESEVVETGNSRSNAVRAFLKLWVSRHVVKKVDYSLYLTMLILSVVTLFFKIFVLTVFRIVVGLKLFVVE